MTGVEKDKQICATFTWILENANCCWQKNGEFLRSPPFVVDSIKNTKWCLKFYPRGIRGSSDMSVYLRRHEECKGPPTIEVDSELVILSADSSPLTFFEESKDTYSKGLSLGYTHFVKREDAFVNKRSIFLPDDTLTIRCRMWKDENVRVSKVFLSRTRIGVERRSFFWDIENFSSLQPYEKKIYMIKSAAEDETIMSLDLSLTGGQSCEEVIRLEVTNLDQNIKLSTLRVSLLDASGHVLECFQDELWHDIPNKAIQAPLLTKKSLIAKKDAYFPNDVLSLYCESAFTTGVLSDEIEKISYERLVGKNNMLQNKHLAASCLDSEENLSSSTLRDNLKSLFTDRMLCDTELRTSTGAFPAHKSIVSARAPVFQAMFATDMKEKAKEYVDIEDLTDDTVRRMLLYMYTAVVEDLQWESASELYAASDKYDILTLKNRCSSFLKTNLSPYNAGKALLLADLHQDNDLKSVVQDFILKHDKQIINSNDWKHVMQASLKLAADTMCLKFRD